MSTLEPPCDRDGDVRGEGGASWEEDRWPAEGHEASDGSGDEELHEQAELDWFLSPQMRQAIDTFRLGEPGEVVARIARRIRHTALLVDQSRVLIGTMARIAMYHDSYDGEIPRRDWVDARIDEALADQLVRDREAERRGLPVLAPYQPRFEYLARTLGIPLEHTRRACVAVNARPEDERQVFFEAILMRHSLANMAKRGMGPRERLEAKLTSVLVSLTESGVAFDAKAFRGARGGERFRLEGLGD